MNASRTYTTDALVLRNRPLGEKDRIVSLFSREHGKIPCVAKGARRPGSKLAAPTQPFTFAMFALAKGRNFDIITQVRIHDPFYALHTNLLGSACASSAVELIERALSERHPEPALFDLLMGTIQTLATNDGCEVALRAFQVRAAGLLGYQPELINCVRCSKPRRPVEGQGTLFNQASADDGRPVFSFNFGGTLCEACRSYDLASIRVRTGTIETLSALMNGGHEQLQHLRIPDFMRGELARVVEGWLEHRLELRLRTKTFLAELLKNS